MSTIGLLHKFQSRLTERFTYAAMEIFKEVEHIVRGYQEENERLRFLLYNRRNPRMNSPNIDHNRFSRSATAVREQPPELNAPVEPELSEPLTKLPKMEHKDTLEPFANIPEDEQTKESKPLANILKEELTEISVSPAMVSKSVANVSIEQQIEYDGCLAPERESEQTDNCITVECFKSDAKEEHTERGDITASLRDMALGNFTTPTERFRLSSSEGILNKDLGPLELQKNSYKKRSTRDDRPKRKNVMTTIALKKELIAKWECGTRVSDLAIQYNMAKSTISTILKRKEAIKAADVAKGVKTLSSRRSDKVEEVEKVLLEWITHKQLRGDTVSETLICDKARELHNALTRDNPGGSADEFKASKGWFCKFKKRSGIHGVLRPGEAARAEKESNNKFEDELEDFVDNQGFLS
ncbi:uncharacterized protein LOC129186098 [Dunckerocampus dactyliophorus]|uniref:uncharacterized protein LOC129186098 n=1 Tax=Dunckerocampus dactyliophorus TaxID=161453 RepID=UPI0024064C88|nr:uncharacterized protein LOC129186098 [Dunckerocampus dactyliophorus]